MLLISVLADILSGRNEKHQKVFTKLLMFGVIPQLERINNLLCLNLHLTIILPIRE